MTRPKLNNKTLLIIAVFILLGGLFYWFQVRPTNARRGCAFYAKEQACFNDGSCNGDKYDFRFKKCLNENGLK